MKRKVHYELSFFFFFLGYQFFFLYSREQTLNVPEMLYLLATVLRATRKNRGGPPFLKFRISLNPYCQNGTSFRFSAQCRLPAFLLHFFFFSSSERSLVFDGRKRDFCLAIWGRGEGSRNLPALQIEFAQNLFTASTSPFELLVVSNSSVLLSIYVKNQPIFYHVGTLIA